ncbi:MAG TPA: hypothetical protein VK365_03345 [Nocardioidaceae bacterium]|jgi:hypothetical protein|nr:hypothetical protein [Nocardioidaceae bacterium]
MITIYDENVVARKWAAVRRIASTPLCIGGTRMPSAAPRARTAAGTDLAFDGTLVGSPAWSPPT